MEVQKVVQTGNQLALLMAKQRAAETVGASENLKQCVQAVAYCDDNLGYFLT